MKTERRLAKEREVIMGRKRIAAWLLCVVLALGLLPATVWADPQPENPKDEKVVGMPSAVHIVCHPKGDVHEGTDLPLLEGTFERVGNAYENYGKWYCNFKLISLDPYIQMYSDIYGAHQWEGTW